MNSKNKWPVIDLFYAVWPIAKNGKFEGTLSRITGCGMECIWLAFDEKNNLKVFETFAVNNSFKNYKEETETFEIDGQKIDLPILNDDWFKTKPIKKGDCQNLSDTILYLVKQLENQKLGGTYLDLEFNIDDRDGHAEAVYNECKKVLGGKVFIPDFTYDFSSRAVRPEKPIHRVVITPSNSSNPIYLKELKKIEKEREEARIRYEEQTKD